MFFKHFITTGDHNYSTLTELWMSKNESSKVILIWHTTVFYICVYVHVYALSYQMSDNFYILVDVPTMDLRKIKDNNDDDYEDIPDNWTV
jgi:hypothetical protein